MNGSTKFLIVFVSIAFVTSSKVQNENLEKEEIELDTKLNGGKIIGKIMQSHKGENIYSFQGIPYVEKPDRFKKTINAKTSGYDSPLDARSMGRPCLQASNVKAGGEHYAIGDEDCLFINVYTPINPSKETDLLPVMVFIHGGQFVRGDASPYMPVKLLDEDVLLVTFHYRLGALGFYSIGGDGTFPGNLALYDQNVALKWVNKYIEDFGGDNKKITLFGQDAGAISAIYHLLADKSKDIDEDGNSITLFHGIIANSGSALDPLAFDQNGAQTETDLAAAVGCKGTGAAACMVDLLPEKIALAAVKLAEDRNVHFPMLAPRVEKSGGGFIVKSPMELIVKGEYEKLPIMLGTCAQEGSFVFGEFYSSYLAPDKKDEDEEYLNYAMVPDLVDLAGIYDPLEFVSSSLYETYLKNVDRTVFKNMISGMIDMTGSLFYKAGILETAKISYENNWSEDNKMGKASAADIFLYSFEYKGEESMFSYYFIGADERPDFNENQIGVTHGDDLIYLLTMSTLSKAEDEKTMERMTNMWANFATKQDPNPISGILGGKWQPYTNEKQEYLSIGDKLTPMEDYEERYTILVDKQLNFTWPPFTTTPDPVDECTCKMLRDLEEESEAYMITMIVFIILFAIACVFAVYSFLNKR